MEENRGNSNNHAAGQKRRNQMMNLLKSMNNKRKKTLIDVELHIAANEDEKPSLFASCLHHCNQERDSLQKCAFYCSALLLFFPKLKQVMVDALEKAGANVLVINNPEERFLDDAGEGYTCNINLVYMGQLVLFLYKNISSPGFTNRTNALKAHAGVEQETKLAIALGEQTAVAIRELLGTDRNLKISVLNTILSLIDNQHPIGNVCGYLSGILEWTDKAPFTFIDDMLVLSKSPVMDHQDPVIQKEVINFGRANLAVNKYDTPEYFKILAPPHEARLVERSQFPVLASVAQTLKSRVYPSMAHFHQQRNVDTVLVNRLLALHKAYVDAPIVVTLEMERSMQHMYDLARSIFERDLDDESDDSDSVSGGVNRAERYVM